MKQLRKLVKVFLILLFSVSILLFAAALLLQDKVGQIVLSSINRNVSVKVETGSFRLSFLKRFPNASLILKDVIVHSCSDFDQRQFNETGADTLLYSKSVFVYFRPADILRGKYNIGTITAKDGKLNLLVDSEGSSNYKISKSDSTREGDDFTIDLRRINLHGISVIYSNKPDSLMLTGSINNGKLRSRISGDDIDFEAAASLEISLFILNNTLVRGVIPAEIDIALTSSDEGVRFNRGGITIDKNVFSLDGFVSEAHTIDLSVKGNKIDIASVRNFIPEKYKEAISGYDPSGKMSVDCTVRGSISESQNPHFEISSSLENGEIVAGRSGGKIKNLSFSCLYTNGAGNSPATSSFSVRDLKFDLGGNPLSGSLKISGFDRPRTFITLKGDVYPEAIKQFFSLQKLSASGGPVNVDLILDTYYWPHDSITLNDITDLQPEATLTISSASIGWKDLFLVTGINGKLYLSDSWRAEGFSFDYKGQKISIDGEFRNLPQWLSGRHVNLLATGDIQFNRLIPETFFTEAKPGKQRSGLPDDMQLELGFKVGTLEYKTFASKDIVGTLKYRPGNLTFNSLSMKSLGGVISGNGFILQNRNKSYISKGDFDVTEIDINKAFVTFHNFGQDFIKADNLSGLLSGSVSVLIPMDPRFKPSIESVSAEGKFTLVNGALINFEPVKHLSKFIELSELENIHFMKLENDFFIRHNVLYIPQMDVRSSAADLSVNGQHSFTNDYEYHVKVLLSQILSRKRKKSNNLMNEFGVIQDDGLGRTSLLLKIEDKGDDVKVNYDLKAVTTGVKNNIIKEKKALKTILNEEYGWYRNEPDVNKDKPAKKSRFNIVWDETDSIK